MTHTRELFREDSYLRECQAEVIAISDDGIQLDQTIFYPLGGGQPGDTGQIFGTNGEVINIKDTRKSKSEPGAIYHIPDQENYNLDIGDKVTLKINWNNRYIYMRYHTCLHVFCSLLDYPVTGGNISLNKARLDFDMPDGQDKELLTDRLNELIDKKIDLQSRWITDEEMQQNMDLVKTMSVKPPMGFGKVRLIEIPGIDLQPCGGTHLHNTGEIGTVIVKKIENKGKQNRRVILELVN
ncbi:MAG: alanyl-tRNA editing protein [Kangiellaceae bacterium]|jgi:misacylated tRNA(Ala) deacylase|nr:alanyl-tRNA editing protein [Kangiellaceae bacterium]